MIIYYYRCICNILCIPYVRLSNFIQSPHIFCKFDQLPYCPKYASLFLLLKMQTCNINFLPSPTKMIAEVCVKQFPDVIHENCVMVWCNTNKSHRLVHFSTAKHIQSMPDTHIREARLMTKTEVLKESSFFLNFFLHCHW